MKEEKEFAMKLRKRIMLFFAVAMLYAFTMTAMANVSPTPHESTEDETEETSPKTGESNIFLYSLGGAGVFAVIMLASARKLRKES